MYLLLFDIDGTLVSMKKGVTGKLISQIIRELYNKDLPPGLYPRFAGRTDLFIIEKITEMLGGDIRQIRKDITKIFAKATEVYEPFMLPEYIDIMPGVAELLESLAEEGEFKLGLITGNHEKVAYMKLKAWGLDKYFDVGAFGSDHKDRGQLPLIAINRANKLARKQAFGRYNTLVFGDTRRDIECAKACNISSAAVATGLFGFNELSSFHPDILFKDFTHTRRVIHRIQEHFRKNLEKMKNEKNNYCS